MAQEHAPVGLWQLFPELGDVWPQRIHDLLPVVGALGADAHVADQPGEAD